MIKHEIIIKLEKNNTNEMSDVLNEMFEHERLSKECYEWFIKYYAIDDFMLRLGKH